MCDIAYKLVFKKEKGGKRGNIIDFSFLFVSFVRPRNLKELNLLQIHEGWLKDFSQTILFVAMIFCHLV